jgi:ferredoxin--NADP+ reductase
LAGNVSATDFVAWYNGHPDHAGDTFDLSKRRVVIVGNGNVALDVARILTSDPESLADTDIAPYALRALRHSKVEEVVILGRRGPAESAFTVPEFVGLLGADVDITIEGELPEPVEGLPYQVEQKLRLLRGVATARRSLERASTATARRSLERASTATARRSLERASAARKRIVFRYLAAPTEILGTDEVSGIKVARNELVTDADGRTRAVATGETERLDAGLVLTSVGYRGVALPGLPFDDQAAVIPNLNGRVLRESGGSVLPGSYVTGWIKRGPTGFIGTNKSCAQETVQQLADDFNAGRLPEPRSSAKEFDRLVRNRQPAVRATGAAMRPGPIRRLLARA